MLDESQAGIKIARRNINNVRYADDITLMAESEEKLKSLLMRVKEESEKPGLKLKFSFIHLIRTDSNALGRPRLMVQGRRREEVFRMGNTCIPVADSC